MIVVLADTVTGHGNREYQKGAEVTADLLPNFESLLEIGAIGEVKTEKVKVSKSVSKDE